MGPAPSVLMREKLRAWLRVITDCAGALCTIAMTIDAAQILRAAHVTFLATSDAAGEGRGEPGIGGYVHDGMYWRIVLTLPLLSLMHITAWETLAAAITILVTHRLAGATATIAERSEAALTPYALTTRKSKSTDIQMLLHELLPEPRFTQASERLVWCNMLVEKATSSRTW